MRSLLQIDYEWTVGKHLPCLIVGVCGRDGACGEGHWPAHHDARSLAARRGWPLMDGLAPTCRG